MIHIASMTRFFSLIILLLQSLSINAQSQKELRDSLSKASEELAYHPDSIDLILKKASWNVQLKQWDYARVEYNKVLAMKKDNLAALYYRAYVNEQEGRYKFARLDYEHLLQLVPGNYEASLGLALLNQKDKHYTEALDQINRLCNFHPDKAEVFAARAGIEQERDMLDLADYDFTEALRLDPTNTDYLLSRVDVRLRLGKRQEARMDLDRLVELGIPRPALTDLYKQTK